jgi:hypothetical protein
MSARVPGAARQALGGWASVSKYELQDDVSADRQAVALFSPVVCGSCDPLQDCVVFAMQVAMSPEKSCSPIGSHVFIWLQSVEA